MKDFPSFGRTQSSRLVRQSSTTGRRKSNLRLGLAWVLLFLVAAFFVRQRIEFLRAERRVSALMAEKQKLLSEILPLKLEESYLTRIARIEVLAQPMGLSVPGEWQKFYAQPTGSGDAPPAGEPSRTKP